MFINNYILNLVSLTSLHGLLELKLGRVLFCSTDFNLWIYLHYMKCMKASNT